MKAILSERNLVVVLFILVLITFSFAHEDTKKMETSIGISTSVTRVVYFHPVKPVAKDHPAQPE